MNDLFRADEGGSETQLMNRSKKSIYEQDSYLGLVPSFAEEDSEYKTVPTKTYRRSSALASFSQ